MVGGKIVTFATVLTNKNIKYVNYEDLVLQSHKSYNDNFIDHGSMVVKIPEPWCYCYKSLDLGQSSHSALWCCRAAVVLLLPPPPSQVNDEEEPQAPLLRLTKVPEDTEEVRI